jgi:hypothetical protein
LQGRRHAAGLGREGLSGRALRQAADPRPALAAAAADQPWDGVWNADRKGAECIQVLRPHDINHYFGEEATSEDCL